MKINTSYNQRHADLTGQNYYQVTRGSSGWNVWAENEGEAIIYILKHYGGLDVWPLKVSIITKSNKTENGGNNNG